MRPWASNDESDVNAELSVPITRPNSICADKQHSLGLSSASCSLSAATLAMNTRCRIDFGHTA